MALERLLTLPEDTEKWLEDWEVDRVWGLKRPSELTDLSKSETYSSPQNRQRPLN